MHSMILATNSIGLPSLVASHSFLHLHFVLCWFDWRIKFLLLLLLLLLCYILNLSSTHPSHRLTLCIVSRLFTEVIFLIHKTAARCWQAWPDSARPGPTRPNPARPGPTRPDELNAHRKQYSVPNVLCILYARFFGDEKRQTNHGTQSIRAVQRGHLKDCTSHLRRAARICPGADPFYLLLGWSRRHRSASGLQSARVRRRPTNLRIDGSERCCWSYGSYVALHRVCRVMDELKSTPAQPIKNRVDMARHESPIVALRWIQHDSLWCWRPASRLCSRSWYPDRQQHDTFESRQQFGWHLLLSATPVTYHPTVPDDRCCTFASSGPDPHPNRLL